MATRHETNRQKERLKEALRLSCNNGTMRPGEPAPSLRNLAEEWNLSKNVISQSLQELIDEGLFHTIPRVGTFVGQAGSNGKISASESYFLMLVNADTGKFQHHRAMRIGFEDRLATRGGSVLTVEVGTVKEMLHRGELPAVTGVFDLAWLPQAASGWWHEFPDSEVPRVRFGWRDEGGSYDLVNFDDFGGGQLATQHLLNHGHRRIAFLGLHTPDHADSLLSWSREREQGWKGALCAAGLSTEGLAFHPGREPQNLNEVDEIRVARRVAHELLRRPDITAVVAANDHAAYGLLRTLRSTGAAPESWPAIVGFDNDPDVAAHLMTSLRLSWEDIGRAAADLLWARVTEGFAGPVQQRSVPMKLIPRLTSRPAWTQAAGSMALAATV